MSDRTYLSRHNKTVSLLLKTLKKREYDSVDDLFDAALARAMRKGDHTVLEGELAEASWTLERRGLLKYDDQWRPRLVVAP